MAAESNYGVSEMLTAETVREIAGLPVAEAKKLLAEKLGIPPYPDPKDQQKTPFISFIYDNITFATEKGFPWEHVCHVVKFAHEFLKRILVENHQLSDAIQDFKKLSVILAPLNSRQQKQYADFIYETVLCHYNLYKYVFSHLRDVIAPQVEKEVIVPVVPPPLSEGEDIVVWEYKQKVLEIEKKEKETLEQHRKKLEELGQQTGEHKTLDDLQHVPTPYSKMTMEELVQDVIKGYAEKKEAELKLKAEEVITDLSYKFEKTAEPRPGVIGSPPRFKPKSPISVAKPNTNNNLNADRDKRSARSSSRSARGKSGRASVTSSMSKK